MNTKTSSNEDKAAKKTNSLISGLQPYIPVVKYVAKRFGIYLLTVWGAITIAFIFFRLMPGDPLSLIFSDLQRENVGRVTGGQDAAEAYRWEPAR